MLHRITRLLSVAAISGLSTVTLAQTENSAFTVTGHGVATPFVTDYQALGINPANLDLMPRYEGTRFTMGFLEAGLSLSSDVLTRAELRNNFFPGKNQSFTPEEQRELALEFANSTNVADADVMTSGFAARTNKLGTFAFSTRERMDFYSKMGSQASDLFWMGNTAPYFEQLVLNNGDTIANYEGLSDDTLAMVVEGLTSIANAQSFADLLDGTELRFQWVREFNLGYGKKLLGTDNWELHGGVGIKFLVGQGLMQIKAENGTASAFSSLAPIFQVDYDELAEGNTTAISENDSPLTPVGFGIGLDFGATFILKNKYILSAAITDIGSMKWDGNVYQLSDGPVTSMVSGGLDNVDFIDQVEELNGANGILDWEGEGTLKTDLPMTGRFGLGINFNNKLMAGFDVVTPMTDGVGSMDKAVIAVGGTFSPVPWVHLSMGFMQGGNYEAKVPAGVTFTTQDGKYELGIASRDMVTFFTRDQPVVSASLGFMRFRF